MPPQVSVLTTGTDLLQRSQARVTLTLSLFLFRFLGCWGPLSSSARAAALRGRFEAIRIRSLGLEERDGSSSDLGARGRHVGMTGVEVRRESVSVGVMEMLDGKAAERGDVRPIGGSVSGGFTLPRLDYSRVRW